MKQERHGVIRAIVRSEVVPTQLDLLRRLARRGHHVTQATLSRDIRELGLAKGPAGYSVSDGALAVETGPGIRDVFHSFGLEVRQAVNLLVLITTTGGAQPVAAGIDYEDWPEVVGTIAGDDTVLVVCPSVRQASSLGARIEGYLG